MFIHVYTALQVYATNKDLGSITKVYERLRAVEVKHPVADNMGGSYVTMFSKSGIIFGIINIIGGWLPVPACAARACQLCTPNCAGVPCSMP